MVLSKSTIPNQALSLELQNDFISVFLEKTKDISLKAKEKFILKFIRKILIETFHTIKPFDYTYFHKQRDRFAKQNNKLVLHTKRFLIHAILYASVYYICRRDFCGRPPCADLFAALAHHTIIKIMQKKKKSLLELRSSARV